MSLCTEHVAPPQGARGAACASIAGRDRGGAEFTGFPAPKKRGRASPSVACSMLRSCDMDNLGWRLPRGRVDAETARRNILSQHERIRGLLEGARQVAESALDGQPPTPESVASAIGDIRTTVEVHLAFEEGVLLPILRDDLPLGPERADRLLAEHQHQRQVLATLHREASRGPDRPTLAAKLAFLTTWLLEDMGHEERFLLTCDIVRDDHVVIDQSSG